MTCFKRVWGNFDPYTFLREFYMDKDCFDRAGGVFVSLCRLFDREDSQWILVYADTVTDVNGSEIAESEDFIDKNNKIM